MTYGPLAGTFADYEYDSLNRLVSVSDGTGVTEYTYDGEGTRMSAGGRTYVTDPNHELSQLLMSSDDRIGVTYYVYAPGYGLLSQDSPTDGYRIFHFDHRGNTIALTDEWANVTDEFSYTVYGEIENGYNSEATIFLFAGQYGVQTDVNGLYNNKVNL